MSILDLKVGNVPFVVVMAVPTVAALGIIWPVHGAVTRIQASYFPLVKDSKASRSQAPGLWAMLRRVKALEGWYGLYKGSYAVLASTISLVVTSYVWTSQRQITPLLSELGTVNVLALTSAWLTITGVPLSVILNRAVITPYRLPNNPLTSLKILLSKREYSKPYTLYSNPGLIFITLLQNLPYAIVARSVALPISYHPRSGSALTWNALAMIVGWQLVGVALGTPVEVIAAKLSTQMDSGDVNNLAGKGLEYCSSGEEVVQLRKGKEPYRGVLDCANKIVEEEGLGALYRGWWWVLAVNVMGIVQYA